MLKGFSVPKTSAGTSGLAPAPPWHYVGHFLAIEYLADPAQVVALLPPGLEPDLDSGMTVAHFADWQACTNAGDELVDPIRSQYREFFVTVAARHRGDPVFYCPFIYVDQDVSLYRGHLQGLPKKLGSVHLTRAYSVASPASAPVRKGTSHGGTLSVNGRRLAEGQVQFDEGQSELIGFATRPTFGIRHFPDLSRQSHDEPLVYDLVRLAARDRQLGQPFNGTAELVLNSGPGDELGLLAPIEVRRGCRYEMALTIDDVVVIEPLCK